jgi:hypothetical protein
MWDVSDGAKLCLLPMEVRIGAPGGCGLLVRKGEAATLNHRRSPVQQAAAAEIYDLAVVPV